LMISRPNVASDLVIRITQHEHGTGGDSLKRAAAPTTVTVAGEDGTVQHVAKKPKPSKPKPSPKTIYSRIQKRIQASCQKKYQSYWGAKAHAPEVCSLMSTLLYSLEDYSEKELKLVFDGCYAIVSLFVENYDDFQRPGYCEDLESMAQTVVDYTNEVRNSVPQNDLQRLADTMIEWDEVASDHFSNADFDMEEAARIICNGPETETAVAEDKKPAAKEPSASPDNAVAEDKKPAAKETPASPDTAATEPSSPHSNS
jgi:hypothetical protein